MAKEPEAGSSQPSSQPRSPEAGHPGAWWRGGDDGFPRRRHISCRRPAVSGRLGLGWDLAAVRGLLQAQDSGLAPSGAGVLSRPSTSMGPCKLSPWVHFSSLSPPAMGLKLCLPHRYTQYLGMRPYQEIGLLRIQLVKMRSCWSRARPLIRYGLLRREDRHRYKNGKQEFPSWRSG